MAKVIVEHEGKRHEFEGSYVIGFAIDASDEAHVAVNGMHYGWGRTRNKAIALGGIVRSALYSLFLEELLN